MSKATELQRLVVDGYYGEVCDADHATRIIMALEKERDEAIFERDVASNLDRHQRELIESISKERDEALAKVKIITDYCNDILNASQTACSSQYTAHCILRKLRGEG